MSEHMAQAAPKGCSRAETNAAVKEGSRKFKEVLLAEAKKLKSNKD